MGSAAAYLEGEDFQLFTDHQVLRCLMTYNDTISRLVRCRLRLIEFSYTLGHRKGVKTQIADAMNWLHTDSEMKLAEVWEVLCFLAKAEEKIAAKEEIYSDLRVSQLLGTAIKPLLKHGTLQCVVFKRMEPPSEPTSVIELDDIDCEGIMDNYLTSFDAISATEPVHELKPITKEAIIREREKVNFCKEVKDDFTIDERKVGDFTND